jgi:arylsulfatase A-like enzyme
VTRFAPQRCAGCLALALLAVLALHACAGAAPPERIVLIVIDTLRRDALGCYGGQIATPNLDALAARGVAVQGMSSAYFETSASMAALFTGRTPSIESGDAARPLPWTGETWCGMARFGAPGDTCIPASLPTLAQQIHEAGYWTIGVLSNELLHEPSGFGRGFDDLVELGGRRLERGTLPWQARAWKRVHLAAAAAVDRRLGDRFFLYVHLMDAHDHPLRHDEYADGVREADAGVGALLAYLAERRLQGGSVVVVTSDHGEQLGETHPPFPHMPRHSHYGNPSYEELLAVPLVVAPAQALGDRPPRNTTELHDWLLRLAGVPTREPETGDLAGDELFVSELGYRTFRGDGWKSAFDRKGERVVLFDLREDPREQRDLAAERPDVVAAHRRRVDELTRSLAARGARRTELSDDDRLRLQALGYLDARAPEDRP